MNESEMIQTAVCGCDRNDLYVDPRPLTDRQRSLIDRMQERRRQGEPLQYILGQTDFMGLTLKVDERIFIPRPETEILVESVIHKAASRPRGPVRILDIGTGSGNIAISLARFIPQAHVTAIDVSADALTVARSNARLHGVERNIAFGHASCRQFFKSNFRDPRKFDMIVSNPPYIPVRDLEKLPEEVRREPVTALDGGPDGLDLIRLILGEAGGLLAETGFVALEIGDGQSSEVASLARTAGIYGEIVFIRDYAQTDRIVMAHRRAP